MLEVPYITILPAQWALSTGPIQAQIYGPAATKDAATKDAAAQAKAAEAKLKDSLKGFVGQSHVHIKDALAAPSFASKVSSAQSVKVEADPSSTIAKVTVELGPMFDDLTDEIGAVKHSALVGEPAPGFMQWVKEQAEKLGM